MKARLEWFPHYPDRFALGNKTRLLTTTQVGVYWLLIGCEWSNGPIPDDEDELIGICRGAHESDVRFVVERCFRLTDEGWINPQLEEIRSQQISKREKKSIAGKASARARSEKKAQQSSTFPTGVEQPFNQPPNTCSTNRVEESREEEKKVTSESVSLNGTSPTVREEPRDLSDVDKAHLDHMKEVNGSWP